MNKNIYKMNGRRVELFYEFSENASLFGNMCLFDENTLLWEENKKLKTIVKAQKSQWSGSENRSFNLGFD